MKKAALLITAILICLSLYACSDTKTNTLADKTAVTEAETEAVAVTEAGTEAESATEISTVPVTEGTTAHVHQWSNATCLAPKTCKDCGKTEGATGEHTYKKATCTQPEECRVCGEIRGEALGCTAGTDGNCIRCGKTLVTIETVLSAPIDTLAELNTFVHGYFSQHCYMIGNFRLIFNTVDGIYLSWGARNISDKEIESIIYKLEYFDVYGNPARDDITGLTSFTGQLFGPFEPGKRFYFRKIVGYGSRVRYGQITDMTVIFSDGTQVSGWYGYKTWNNIRTEDSPNECYIIE